MTNSRFNFFGPGKNFSKAQNENEIRPQKGCIIFDLVYLTREEKLKNLKGLLQDHSK